MSQGGRSPAVTYPMANFHREMFNKPLRTNEFTRLLYCSGRQVFSAVLSLYQAQPHDSPVFRLSVGMIMRCPHFLHHGSEKGKQQQGMSHSLQESRVRSYQEKSNPYQKTTQGTSRFHNADGKADYSQDVLIQESDSMLNFGGLGTPIFEL